MKSAALRLGVLLVSCTGSSSGTCTDKLAQCGPGTVCNPMTGQCVVASTPDRVTGILDMALSSPPGAFSAESTGTAVALSGVWGSDANNVWGGAAGTLVKCDGTTWRVQASGTPNTLNGIWGSAANNVWTVGSSGTILHRKG